ncbi:MAG: hypothetical protein GVY10_06235 [Verrucomicrobia bacterium]|jgi:signal transduction histidine kinase|nr:hypothetical protein [Verrucomicrobiota bacterium]
MRSQNDARLLDLPYCSWEWYPREGSWRLLQCFNPDQCLICQHLEGKEGQGWKAFLPDARAGEVEEALLHTLHKRPDCHLRLHLSGKNETESRNMIFHAMVAESNGEGEIVKVLGLCRPEFAEPDQTSAIDAFNSPELENRRRMELLLMNAERFESIANLAGNIAHDLNNLIAPIRMATQLLRRKAEEPAIDRYVEIIEDSTSRARSVIQQILSFSKDTNHGDYRIIKVEEVLGELERLARETFPERLEIVFNRESSLPEIEIDPTQLHQALLNMMVNARDAIEGSGRISLHAGLRNVDIRVSVGGRSLLPGSYVCLSVSDTGCGIDAETQQKIFDPFFTTKPKEQGTGLGLASVYGIIARAGGFIDVESVEGEGTTFHIFLPPHGKTGTVTVNTVARIGQEDFSS